jgi:hypothetical protein
VISSRLTINSPETWEANGSGAFKLAHKIWTNTHSGADIRNKAVVKSRSVSASCQQMACRRPVVCQVSKSDGAGVPNGFGAVAAQPLNQQRHDANREHSIGKTSPRVGQTRQQASCQHTTNQLIILARARWMIEKL